MKEFYADVEHISMPVKASHFGIECFVAGKSTDGEAENQFGFAILRRIQASDCFESSVNPRTMGLLEPRKRSRKYPASWYDSIFDASRGPSRKITSNNHHEHLSKR
uniref:Uncharacterized protein n=1 Tax=Candidatus Kentrum sp. TC TaxID=2126339 RepID=A0A450YEX1_9GAMM|nr:MAG: hypothetical protein BECKTC1821E_GA0114239_100672 [Candidatus Kentron sp. TC]